MIDQIEIKRIGPWRNEDARYKFVKGASDELKMIDRMQIKRIGWWRDEDERYKFVKDGD
jgi:hypothetical protein